MTPPRRPNLCLSLLLSIALGALTACLIEPARSEVAQDAGAVVTAVDAEAIAFHVHHSPYLQPGDMPLVGYKGSETDRIDVLWQTMGGSRGDHRFDVAYREVGQPGWRFAGAPSRLETGVEQRVVHGVTLPGLKYAAQYEYRVQHWQRASVIGAWQARFRTRLAAGDDPPFTFAAYGDSAALDNISAFRAVQARINKLAPDFVLLLGDNAYEDGSHAQLDARFDPKVCPEAARWNASHIDYFAIGNHDIRTEGGKPSRDSYSAPAPVAGVNAPASPPANEPAEHNYSFDYGCVHFATFDSNTYNEPQRLDALLDWLVADLAATKAKWKIVFAHHPVGGAPDKNEGPGDHYYQQVVSRLRKAGVDLFLVGHSHTQSRTFPLLGAEDGKALFVNDTDNDYAKGAGLVQVIAGAGGKSLRPGVYTHTPFVARGFTTETKPALEYGFVQVDVTPTQLSVTSIAAENGAMLDRFTITAPR